MALTPGGTTVSCGGPAPAQPSEVRTTTGEAKVAFKAPQVIPTCSQGLAPLPESRATQQGGHEPRVAAEHLKCGKSKSGVFQWEMHTGLQELAQKREGK